MVLTTKEAAAYLRVHTSTLYRALAKHQIPAFRMGSDYRFDTDQLQVWMRAQSARTLAKFAKPEVAA